MCSFYLGLNKKNSMENYQKGMFYEIFMRRAFKGKQVESAHAALFKNLLDAEDGIVYSCLPPYSEQFKKIKNYLDKALDAFIKNKKLKENEINQMVYLKRRLKNVASGQDFFEIIDKGLDSTHDYK
jgi:adenylate kinase family enzyme